MSNLLEKIAQFNEDLKHYTVQPVEDSIQEDGNYGGKGYGIVNNETGVTEHTTICLPAALYQATHFDDMLTSLLTKKPSLSLVDQPTEDVLPN